MEVLKIKMDVEKPSSGSITESPKICDIRGAFTITLLRVLLYKLFYLTLLLDFNTYAVIAYCTF
jgi:hypothetical protein